jgi:hypothetical protein
MQAISNQCGACARCACGGGVSEGALLGSISGAGLELGIAVGVVE